MEDTLTKPTEQDNEALIAEMLRDATPAEVISGLTENPVIHKGDEILEAPMTVKEMTSAGYKSIWDSRTYEWAPVLYYMLQQKLRERREDGSFIWTTNDPKKLPKRGTHKCLLHKDSPNRNEYDKMGLRTCKKSNIINDYEVKQHMSKKHPKEWQAIEDMRKERERQEDRAFQKTLYEAVGKKATLEEEKPPLYVSDKPPKARKKRTVKVK